MHNKLHIQVETNDAYHSDFSAEQEIRGTMVVIPPVMFVHVSEVLRSKIFKSTWKLKDLKEETEGYGCYVRQSLPESHCAVHKKYASFTEKREKKERRTRKRNLKNRHCTGLLETGLS